MEAARPSADGLGIVKAEVHRLTTAMRTNQRWASHARFVREIPMEQESPMLRSLKTLYRELQGVEDLYACDTVTYTRPFLQVITSEETSGVITGIALSAVNKFLLYGFVNLDAPRGIEAVNRIAHAATHCRFEPVSTTDDEAVLSKLLEVLGNTLRCDAGRSLTDAAVWSMVHCAFLISRIDKASPLLMRSAEATLAAMVMHVFSRARAFVETGRAEDGVLSMSEFQACHTEGEDSGVVDAGQWVYEEWEGGVGEEVIEGAESRAAPSKGRRARRPYGPPVLQRLLSWLASLTDPRKHSRSTRMLGMELVNIVLETGGAALGDLPPVVAVAQDAVCKHLIANSRTADLPVLSLALRVVFNLFASLKRHLKVQLEVFLTSVHLFLADSRSAAPEQRELALESLLEFTRERDMMLDLYANFDCDVACTNLYEATVRCMCRNAVPEAGAPLTSLHAIALEGVLVILDAMARRCPGHPSFDAAVPGGTCVEVDDGIGRPGLVHARSRAHSPLSSPALLLAPEPEGLEPGQALGPGAAVGGSTAVLLRQRRQLKRRMALAAAKFSADPRGWVEYTQELGLLPTPADAEAVARFLRECPGIDRTALGLYIAEPDDVKHAFNTAVRSAYISGFDFAELRVDSGLRLFLESFRLPGEAQKIERLMLAFSERLFGMSPGPMAHSDTAFVLAYSIIMLNTDLHNPQVRKKMTKAQFLSNNRGIDAGKDLPPEYLTAIYDSILEKEIHMRADVSMLSLAHGSGAGVPTAQSDGRGAGPGSSRAGDRVGDEGMHGSDMDGGAMPSLGTQWDGILSRQATVTAYTSLRGQWAGSGHGSGRRDMRLSTPVKASEVPREQADSPNPSPSPSPTASPAHRTGRQISHDPAHDNETDRAVDPERDMFAIIAEPALHALATVFAATQDPAVLKRASSGFRDCALLAGHYRADAALNALAITVSRSVLSDMDGLGELVEGESLQGRGDEYEEGEGEEGVSGSLLAYARAISHSYVLSVRPGPHPNQAAGRVVHGRRGGQAGRRDALPQPHVQDSSGQGLSTPPRGDGVQIKASQAHAHSAPYVDVDVNPDAPTPLVGSVRDLADGVDAGAGVGRARADTALSALSAGSLPLPLPSSSTHAAFVLRRLTLSLHTLLSLAASHGHAVVEGWVNVVEVLVRLAVNDVLPSDVFTPEDFRAPNGSRMPSSSSPQVGGMDETCLGVEGRGKDKAGTGGGGKAGVRVLAVRSSDSCDPPSSIHEIDSSDPAMTISEVLSGSRHLREVLRLHDATTGMHAHGPIALQVAAGQGAGEPCGPGIAGTRRPEKAIGSGGGLWSTLASLFTGGDGGGRDGEGGGRDEIGEAVLAAVAAEVSRSGALPALLARVPTLPDRSLSALMTAIVSARAHEALRTAWSGGEGQEEATEAISVAFLGELATAVALRAVHRPHLILPPLEYMHANVCAAAGAALGAPSRTGAMVGGGAGSDRGRVGGAHAPVWWAATGASAAGIKQRCALYLCERVTVNTLRLAVQAFSVEETWMVDNLALLESQASWAGRGRPGRATSDMGGTSSSPHDVPSVPLSAFVGGEGMGVQSLPSSPSALATACLRSLCRSLPTAAVPAVSPRLAAGLGVLLQLGPTPAHAHAHAACGAQAGEAEGHEPADGLSPLSSFYDAACDTVELCQPFFYSGPGVWDCLCSLASMGHVHGAWEGQAVALASVQERLQSRVLRMCLHYAHVSTRDSACAGLAAAILMQDEGGALRPSPVWGNAGAGSSVGFGRGLPSSSSRRPRVGRTGTEGSDGIGVGGGGFAERLSALVAGEPLAELRQFSASASLRLLTSLVCGPPTPGSGVEASAVRRWRGAVAVLVSAVAQGPASAQPSPPHPADVWDGLLRGSLSPIAHPLPPPSSAMQHASGWDAAAAMRSRAPVSRAVLSSLSLLLSCPPSTCSGGDWDALFTTCLLPLHEWAFGQVMGPAGHLVGTGMGEGSAGGEGTAPPGLGLLAAFRHAVDLHLREEDEEGGEGEGVGVLTRAGTGAGAVSMPPARALTMSSAELCSESHALLTKALLQVADSLAPTPAFGPWYRSLVHGLAWQVGVMESIAPTQAGRAAACKMGIPPSSMPALLAHCTGQEGEAARSIVQDSAVMSLTRLMMVLGAPQAYDAIGQKQGQEQVDTLTAASAACGVDLWADTWACLNAVCLPPGTLAQLQGSQQQQARVHAPYGKGQDSAAPVVAPTTASAALPFPSLEEKSGGGSPEDVPPTPAILLCGEGEGIAGPPYDDIAAGGGGVMTDTADEGSTADAGPLPSAFTPIQVPTPTPSRGLWSTIFHTLVGEAAGDGAGGGGRDDHDHGHSHAHGAHAHAALDASASSEGDSDMGTPDRPVRRTV